MADAATDIFLDGCDKLVKKMEQHIKLLTAVPTDIADLAKFFSESKEHLHENSDTQVNEAADIDSTKALWMILRYIYGFEINIFAHEAIAVSG